MHFLYLLLSKAADPSAQHWSAIVDAESVPGAMYDRVPCLQIIETSLAFDYYWSSKIHFSWFGEGCKTSHLFYFVYANQWHFCAPGMLAARAALGVYLQNQAICSLAGTHWIMYINL